MEKKIINILVLVAGLVIAVLFLALLGWATWLVKGELSTVFRLDFLL